MLEELSFGGGAINDTLMHLANPNLPFGGVGASGIGEYHGKYSFDTFSHMKSYIFKSTRLDSSIIYPLIKVNSNILEHFSKLIKIPIMAHFTSVYIIGIFIYNDEFKKSTNTPSGAVY